MERVLSSRYLNVWQKNTDEEDLYLIFKKRVEYKGPPWLTPYPPLLFVSLKTNFVHHQVQSQFVDHTSWLLMVDRWRKDVKFRPLSGGLLPLVRSKLQEISMTVVSTVD